MEKASNNDLQRRDYVGLSINEPLVPLLCYSWILELLQNSWWMMPPSTDLDSPCISGIPCPHRWYMNSNAVPANKRKEEQIKTS